MDPHDVVPRSAFLRPDASPAGLGMPVADPRRFASQSEASGVPGSGISIDFRPPTAGGKRWAQEDLNL
jgi:hypothetical protein